MAEIIKFTAHFKRNRRKAIHMRQVIQTDESQTFGKTDLIKADRLRLEASPCRVY